MRGFPVRLVKMKWLARALIGIALAALLYLALRRAPLTEIRDVLLRLRWWQILLILFMDGLIYLLVTARWWFVVHAENKQVHYLPMLPVRISVFGVSYFTLGPQVGGEPLQILYLQKRHGLTYTRATSTVIMDKLLEFLANFLLLAFGLAALVHAGLAPFRQSLALAILLVLVVLLTWPFLHILLMMRGRHPLSWLLHRLPFIPNEARIVRFIRASERLAGSFCRRHPSALYSAVLVSLLAAAGMVGEYFLMTSFLRINLTSWQTAAAWTAGWLSFLMPLPGGLGALEASQVFALGFFGIAAGSAISVALLMRGRDILIGGLGLLLAGRTARKP